jgi:hypothetical protein
MLLIYLPALIFEGFCEMLLEPMRPAERRTRGNRELSAGLGDPCHEAGSGDTPYEFSA